MEVRVPPTNTIGWIHRRTNSLQQNILGLNCRTSVQILLAVAYSPSLSDFNFFCSVEMNLDDKFCNFNTKPCAPTLLGHEFQNIGVPTTDTYYRQKFELFHRSGIKFGCYCGICYRSRKEDDLCHKYCISSIDILKMMFYLTDLILNDTVDTNTLLYKVLIKLGKLC